MKPAATLSLDLDNQWSYMKIHGDSGWETFPSYLDRVIPRILQFLHERDLRITFFVVGQDAALKKNAEALGTVAAAGHEIESHSFHHEPWISRCGAAEIDAELGRAEDALAAVSGRRPVGFRGPGFAVSADLLRVLARRGYRYDASTLPTFIGPLARAYYFKTSRLNAAQKEERRELFGTLADGLRPNVPYVWTHGVERLVEIPVTTMPGLRFPIHFSYLHYLDAISPALARMYCSFAFDLCRLFRTTPSLLLHPLDFVGSDEVPQLAFFPGMSVPSERKLQTLSDLVAIVSRRFSIAPMGDFVAGMQATTSRSLKPRRIGSAEVRGRGRFVPDPIRLD